MKNLIKVLLVLAFSTSAFAASTTQWPAPEAVTTTQIGAMKPADQQAWINSLTPEQYNMLSSDVQTWVQNNTTDAQKQTLGISSN